MHKQTRSLVHPAGEDKQQKGSLPAQPEGQRERVERIEELCQGAFHRVGSIAQRDRSGKSLTERALYDIIKERYGKPGWSARRERPQTGRNGVSLNRSERRWIGCLFSGLLMVILLSAVGYAQKAA